MSLKKSLAKILMCVVLQIGAFSGVPITKEEIEKILNVHRQTRIEFVVKKDDPSRPDA